jgi:outer membrane protein
MYRRGVVGRVLLIRSMRQNGASWVLASAVVLGMSTPLFASETLESALARAYNAHPSLNAQRASLRATNEGVSQAVSGYRPRVNATADAGVQYNDSTVPGARSNSTLSPRGVGLQVDQNIFNGNRTANRVRSAESGVFAAREILRGVEQTILLDAATAYMAVLRDTAVLNLRNNNVEVLEEQLRQVRDRFSVGEVTRTDVAQAEARLAGSRSQSSAAQALLKASLARYRQTVGGEPKKLAPGRTAEKLLPKNLDAAVNSGLVGHPSITAALHNVDLAEFTVKTVEGELYPTLGVTGRVQQRYDSQLQDDRRFSASAVATLTVPIYEGGEVYSRTRAAKETLGQRRLEVDVARDTIRANVISGWGQLEAAKAQILAAQAQVQASETALNGVREEAKVGQRTTLDVLNAQQELLDARVSLISAQRDRVVASYLVLSTIGRLSIQTLGLKTAAYDQKQHFEQVKNKPWGLQVPDGR